MTLELPKPKCYCKETAFDWEMCQKCKYYEMCEFNTNKNTYEGEDNYLDIFLLCY